jgi:alkylhydroperoxidase family enzyme
MRIEPIQADQASPVVRRIYESIERSGRTVSNVFKMLAHRPDVLRAYNQLTSAVWAEGALELRLRDLAYLRASILNGCEF